MKYIRIQDITKTAIEIIPEYIDIFPEIPVTERYSEEFLSECVTVDDSVDVDIGWIYDGVNFSQPVVDIEPEAIAFTEDTPAQVIEETKPTVLHHAKTADTAQQYIKPGIYEYKNYMKGDYMIEGGKTYRCLEDNAVNPPSIQAVAHKWEQVVLGGD